MNEESGWTKPWKSTTFSLKNNEQKNDIFFRVKRFSNSFRFSSMVIQNTEQKTIQIASQENSKQKNIYLFEKTADHRFKLIADLKKMQPSSASEDVDQWLIRDEKKQLLAQKLMKIKTDVQETVYQYEDAQGKIHLLATLSPYPDSYGSWFIEDADIRLQYLLAALLTFKRSEKYTEIRNRLILFGLALGAIGFLGWHFGGQQYWTDYQKKRDIKIRQETLITQHREAFFTRHERTFRSIPSDQTPSTPMTSPAQYERNTPTPTIQSMPQNSVPSLSAPPSLERTSTKQKLNKARWSLKRFFRRNPNDTPSE